jgi:signal transduction histidine kinase
MRPPAARSWRTAILKDSPGKLWTWALLPHFADEERTRAGRTLCVLSLGLMAMGAFSLVQAWLNGWTGAACALAVENLFLIAALGFNRQGEIEWATKIICFSELVCGLLLTSVFGPGFTDEAMLLFPLILVTAAILLDWRSYISFASLVVVSVACSGFILAATGSETRYHRVVNVINILIVTVVAVGLLAHNLKGSVFRSREAERGIRALSARLITAQEEERARLARELHDDLSQQIAAMSIGMGILKSQIPQQQVDARAQCDRIQQKLVNVAENIRRLSHELHPAVLEHSGLASALRTYCSEFGLLTGVRVSLQAHGSFEDVPIPVALCIYRITQEALQNVAKHANVGAAEVELGRSDGVLYLSVSDRGAGIEPSRAAPLVGLGLVSIKERTRLVNGAVEIQSKPNQGTTVRVRIPA